jgi:hypothetical protein
MMNRIMIPGVAAVALAASALLAPTAEAQRQPNICPITGEVLYGGPNYSSYNRGYGYGYNNKRRVKADRQQAARLCRAAIRKEAYNIGFRDVDFDDRHIRQIGPRGFLVTFETEFEGRRREFERDVRCEVRRGRIVALDGVPQPRHRGQWGYSTSYGKRGW